MSFLLFVPRLEMRKSVKCSEPFEYALNGYQTLKPENCQNGTEWWKVNLDSIDTKYRPLRW